MLEAREHVMEKNKVAFDATQIEASFEIGDLVLHTGGSVKPDHADKINDWLRNRAKSDTRAAKALRSIQQQVNQQKQARYQRHQSSLEQEMLGILRDDGAVIQVCR